MGRDKANLPFGPETMLERVVRLAMPAVDEVIVVVREGQDVPPGAGWRLARDRAEGDGPLAGLVAGMEATAAEAVILLGCDHPFLRPELVEHLFDRLGEHQCAVVRAESRLMPLCAVYSRQLLSAARAQLARRDLRLVHLIEPAVAAVIEASEAERVDPGLTSFRNCNTPEDYAAALRDAGWGG